MSVCVNRDLNRTVPYPFFDIGEASTVLNQQRAECLPEVVESEFRSPAASNAGCMYRTAMLSALIGVPACDGKTRSSEMLVLALRKAPRRRLSLASSKNLA